FTDALERIVLGAERQVMMTDADRSRTAYHEAGHAIVGMLTEGADPVRKVSIIPRGLALGVTFAAPESDRFNYREPEVEARIKVALGGRAARARDARRGRRVRGGRGRADRDRGRRRVLGGSAVPDRPLRASRR